MAFAPKPLAVQGLRRPDFSAVGLCSPRCASLSADSATTASFDSISADGSDDGIFFCELVVPGKAPSWLQEPCDEDLASAGSSNHPHACAGPCKYYCKAKGCKDGASCDRCHLCMWTRPKRKSNRSPSASRSTEEIGSDAPVQPHADELVEDFDFVSLSENTGRSPPRLASLGTLGHRAGHCAMPCRDNWRKGGCRAGWSCTRCHLCRWSPAKVAKSVPSSFEYVPGQALLAACHA